MARYLSVASVIEKNKISSDIPWVVLLDVNVVDPNTREVSDVIHIAQNTEDLIYGTDANGDPVTYKAANFNLQVDQKQNETPSVSITAQDQTGYIQARMEEAAGGVFSEVVMTLVNTSRLDKPPEIRETFQITTASAKDYVVTFQLGAENLLAITFPKHRQFQNRCAWRYKGYGCGYSGSMPTCDYTRDGANGCIAHNNEINFRGLPGLTPMSMNS